MMVVGERAETADLSNLELAKWRIDHGIPASQVRKYLGWWQGKDGEWRYEISDKDMDFRVEGFAKNPKTLGDYLKHDELFNAYPELRNLPVNFADTVDGDSTLNGIYNSKKKEITLKSGRTKEQTEATLIHEVQHAVQNIEGFARGASKKEGAALLFNETYNNVKENREFNSLQTPEEKVDFIIRIAEKAGGKSYAELSRDMYASVYGEVEARATAARKNLTKEQLREKQYFNDGVVLEDKGTKRAYIDNLVELGYTKRKANEMANGGVLNGIQQENAAKSSAKRNADDVDRRTRERGGRAFASNLSEKSRPQSAIYRSDEISASDAVANNKGGSADREGLYRVKYSISPESDASYLSAVENGDTEAAQRMVDEAAKAAGYSSRMYHGAKNGGGFTVFRDWGYFTENKAYAERYAQRENKKSLYEVYVKMDKPFDTRYSETREIFENEILPEYGASQIQESGLPDWTDGYDIADHIDENGLDYDAIVLDEGGDLVNGVPVSRGLSYVIKNSAQVKSADPVTYDDNGNVIPLSERFNEGNEDIRYSVSEESEIGASNDSPYDYDTLIRKPDMALTVVDDNAMLSRSDIKAEAIKNAASVGYTNENGNAVVHVDDVNSDVIVPKKSIAHGLDRRTDAQSAVFVKIGEVLKNSVKVNELLPRAESIKNSYVLVGAAVGKNGTPYIVSFIVNKHSNEISEIDVLYSANTKKESAAFLPKIADSTATPTNSKISIAQLLSFVNNNFPDVLPESVLRHFGYTERPKGTIGESALYSLSEEVVEESEQTYAELKREAERAERREQAKAARNAQKSTESEAKPEAEQIPADAEKRAENDERMMVVGEESETADLSALDTAIAMHKADPNADTVSETGWWLGKDGKWRYEIADNEMRFERDGLYKNPQTLEDYIEHDKLFEAYPHLRNIRVEFVDTISGKRGVSGRYIGSENRILLKNGRTDEETKKTLIHEIQHAVQAYEAFNGGSNMELAYSMLFGRIYHKVKSTQEYKQLKTPEDRRKFVESFAESLGEDTRREMAKYLYNKNYGEEEARATANRLRMTEEKRKLKPIQNKGIVYSPDSVRSELVDILKEMGYNESEITKLILEDTSDGGQENSTAKRREERADRPIDENVARTRYEESRRTRGQGDSQDAQHGLRGLKYSISPEADADYLSAVENGDMETVQRMVDEAAKNAGYTIKAYHGTSARFTQFDPDEMSPREGSYFFAENREDAAAYGKNIYEVYLTDRNLADYDNQPTEFYKLRDKRQQVEWLKERGYEGWYADMDSEGWGEYSVFSPSQVKSADPVTYDDNGNVIPLSERFNEGNEDIRWSISPSLDSDIDSVLNGTFDASRNEVYLGETSQFMTDVIGANSLALYMPAAKVYSSILTRDEYNKKPYYSEQGNYHGIGKEDFIDILERSENPIAAFADTPDINGNKRHNRIVLVTDKIIKDAETGEEGYAVVVEEVDANGLDNGKRVKANKAITVYPRTKLNSDISLAIADGRLLDLSKKGRHLFAGVRGANSQAAIRKDVFKKNIANFWANVKWANEKNKIYSSSVTPTTTAMEDAIKNSSYYKSMQNSENDTEGRMSVSEEVLDGSDSQSFADMIAETKSSKESNAALVEKFLNERGKHIDGSSVRKFLNGIIGAYGSEAWYGNVEKKYREMFEKVYNNKGGKVDADTVTEMFREVATLIFDGTTENEIETLVKDIRAKKIVFACIKNGPRFSLHFSPHFYCYNLIQNDTISQENQAGKSGRNKKKPSKSLVFRGFLRVFCVELLIRVELMTSSLPRMCSTN